MKYEAPYGVSDPNASYINGNPSTGTMGSIPPAASIENPQREIANMIAKSGLTPVGTDLTQLAQGIQSGLVNYAADAGTASAYAVTLDPAPVAYHPGLPIRMKIGNTPKGPSTLNVNGLGPKPIMKRNNMPVQAFDFFVGDIIELVYDGAAFQLIGSQATPLLAAPMIYYVATTGSDSNDGLTALTAFLTIQHVLNVINTFNLNGYGVTVYVANGTYPPIIMPRINGSGTISLIGNSSSPASCIISAASSFGGAAVTCNVAGYYMEGFGLTTPNASASQPGAGIWLGAGSALLVKNINFDVCGTSSLSGCYWIACDGGYILFSGTISISGGTNLGFGAQSNGEIRTSVPTKPVLSITAPVTVNMFAWGTSGSYSAHGWQTINGSANVTGQKFFAGSNGVIDVLGAGVNYLPGTIAGGTATGGQYV